MKRSLLLLFTMALGRVASAASCEELKLLTVPFTSVTSATLDTDENGRNHCRVLLTARPVTDSEIHIEMWLPVPGDWNRKFLGTGNGGYSSEISYGTMRTALREGYAVAGSDTGHTGSDLKFAVGHPAKVDDWAYRAIHVITESAKLMIRSFYGRFAQHSYFAGCSTGGQQALSEAQRYPTDYDGIVAGDPGNDRIHLNIGFLWSWRVLHRNAESALPALKLPLLYNTVMAACDALDGVKDGVINDPRRCHFDPAALLCKGGDSTSCLTEPQVTAVREIYSGAYNPRTGERLFPGWVRGSEALPDGIGSWAAYFVEKPEPTRLDFWRYWVFHDPNWSPFSFDFDHDVVYVDTKLTAMTALDPNLSKLKQAGGKLLLYQGWADPVVPPEDTIGYFENVQRAMGGDAQTSSFVRLFLVPGMGHCMGGPGPNTFDGLRVLDRWVGEGIAPDQMIASHWTNGVVDRTRPLCPYPQVARWKGSGSTDDAASFTCVVEPIPPSSLMRSSPKSDKTSQIKQGMSFDNNKISCARSARG
ncbi:MAG: tannase/feruloyl esterase family alpha/beta hydrolase [Acidobacteriaceae bacterium]|nr:tannase/feruloyl esterase family alpha/beta hydrolase [Acidobacteriaceae bacterium]